MDSVDDTLEMASNDDKLEMDSVDDTLEIGNAIPKKKDGIIKKVKKFLNRNKLEIDDALPKNNSETTREQR